MPVYNCLSRFEGRAGGSLLPGAIAALQAQTHQEFQLVVLDNGSKDGTLDLLGEISVGDSRIQVVQDVQQRSSEEAIRVLVEQAEHDYCVIVNDDDLWLPSYLEVLLQLHVEQDVDLAYCNGRYLNMAGHAQTPLTKDADAVYSTRRDHIANYGAYLIHRNPFPITFGMWRTEVLRSHYPTSRFDSYSADTDNLFIANVMRAGARIGYVEADLFRYRNRQRTFSATRAFGAQAPADDACWTFLRMLAHQAALATALIGEGRLLDEAASNDPSQLLRADLLVMRSLVVHAQRTWFGLLAPRAVDRATHRQLVALYRLLFDPEFDRMSSGPEPTLNRSRFQAWSARLSTAAEFVRADEDLRAQLRKLSDRLVAQMELTA